MESPKLALIPSGYKSGTVYSVLPTDNVGDFDFSRTGQGATRVRKDGLIETVDNNVPRLDWLNSDCPSLLLEPQRTNLMLFSEEFSGTSWASLRTTITTNTVISPDGAMTGNTLQRTSTSASYRVHNISKSASAITYTTSAFIKKGSDDYFAMRAQGSFPSRVDIRFRFDTEQIYYAQAVSNFTLIDSDVQNYSNGWYRLSFTYTTDTNSNLAVYFSPRASDGNIDSVDTSSNSFAYVWGAQTEEGSYKSSYIKTTSIIQSRQKDICINAGDADLFNVTEGTFFVDVTPYIYPSANTYISLNDGGSSDRFVFIFQSYGTAVRLFGVSSSSNFLSNYQSITFNTKNKLAITFKQNEFKIYVNGVLRYTDTSGNVPTGLNQLDFTEHNGNRNFQGKVHDTRVYDRVLTQAEAIELTTI